MYGPGRTTYDGRVRAAIPAAVATFAIAGAGALAAALAGCGDDLAAPVPCATTCAVDRDCAFGLSCTAGLCTTSDIACPLSFVEVGAGNGFACARDQYGRALCWGDNAHHQIDGGDRAHVDRMTPTGPAQWDAIAVGGGHACGLRGGALACWGANDRGQVDLDLAGDVPASAPRAIAVA